MENFDVNNFKVITEKIVKNGKITGAKYFINGIEVCKVKTYGTNFCSFDKDGCPSKVSHVVKMAKETNWNYIGVEKLTGIKPGQNKNNGFLIDYYPDTTWGNVGAMISAKTVKEQIIGFVNSNKPKVVTESNYKILYHGTADDFVEFKLDKNIVNHVYGSGPDNGLGIFFTDNKTMAKWFAGGIEYDCDVDSYVTTGKENSFIITAEVSMNKTLEILNENEKFEDSIQQYFALIEKVGGAQELRQILISEGYDSIFVGNATTNYYEEGTYDMYVILNPENITIIKKEKMNAYVGENLMQNQQISSNVTDETSYVRQIDNRTIKQNDDSVMFTTEDYKTGFEILK